jgi:predicted ATPase
LPLISRPGSNNCQIHLPGDCSIRLETPEDVPRETLREVLLQLVSKSLVGAEKEKEGEEPSYRLLETIRLYSLDKLEKSGEAANANSLYRNYYLRLVEECEPGLRGPQAIRWLACLEREHSNFQHIIV